MTSPSRRCHEMPKNEQRCPETAGLGRHRGLHPVVLVLGVGCGGWVASQQIGLRVGVGNFHRKR